MTRDHSFLFGVHSRAGATLTYSVSVPSGMTDSAPGNNDGSVQVKGWDGDHQDNDTLRLSHMGWGKD